MILNLHLLSWHRNMPSIPILRLGRLSLSLSSSLYYYFGCIFAMYKNKFPLYIFTDVTLLNQLCQIAKSTAAAATLLSFPDANIFITTNYISQKSPFKLAQENTIFVNKSRSWFTINFIYYYWRRIVWIMAHIQNKHTTRNVSKTATVAHLFFSINIVMLMQYISPTQVYIHVMLSTLSSIELHFLYVKRIQCIRV